MTRVIPLAIQSSIDTGSATLAWGITITRQDGLQFTFVSSDREKEIDTARTGVPGFDLRSLARTSGLAVDNTEITVVEPDDVITRNDLAAGRWDGAAFEVFQFNWKNPTGGILEHMVGKLGNMQPRGAMFVAELRDLRQALQQDYTQVMQESCRWRFCDERCGLDEADYTHGLTVTSVTSQNEFEADGSGGSPPPQFVEGEIRWLTGDNAGLRVKIRAYDAGTFELAQPMVFPIQVGDTADAIEGCPKAREACKGFNNILNFGGEPDKPAVDAITAPARYE
jgi:uncharacterized phage protein (TIGR02218 family)